MAAGPEDSEEDDGRSIDLTVPSLPSPESPVPGGGYVEFSCGPYCSKLNHFAGDSERKKPGDGDNDDECMTPVPVDCKIS